MKQFRKLLLVFLLTFSILLGGQVFTSIPVKAETPTPGNQVYIYFFWGDGCPHCAKAKPFFEKLAADHPEVILRMYEVFNDASNQEFFTRMANKYQIERMAVPTYFIGKYYQQGYAEEIAPQIEAAVLQCIQNDCGDAAEGMTLPPVASLAAPLPTVIEPILPSNTPPAILSTTATATPVAIPSPSQPTIQSTIQPTFVPQQLSQSHDLQIPWIGKVNLDSKSALTSTILISLVDGFNPCSLWVLSMLLAITLHTGSRKKVLFIGLVFLTVTAGIYALFMLGLFSVFKITSFLSWIRILIALVAIFFAAVNIKDYFWYKEGLSFTIADEKKPGLFKKMRSVMDASQSFGSLLGATVVLSAGVSLVEFSCTAGLPVVWTNLLIAQNVNGLTFGLLLVLYMVIYQLDEMVMFIGSVVTLKATRIEEKHGRVLKLITGILMLTLSLVMLINPALMTSVTSTLLIFGLAFVVSFLVLGIHRLIQSKK